MKIKNMLVASFLYVEEGDEDNCDDFDIECSKLFRDMDIWDDGDYFHWNSDWNANDYPGVYLYLKNHLDAANTKECLITME